MKVEISPSEIEERKADERGRVTLGAEYAHETVKVGIIEVVNDREPAIGDFVPIIAELVEEGKQERAREIAETIGLDIAEIEEGVDADA